LAFDNTTGQRLGIGLLDDGFENAVDAVSAVITVADTADRQHPTAVMLTLLKRYNETGFQFFGFDVAQLAHVSGGPIPITPVYTGTPCGPYCPAALTCV